MKKNGCWFPLVVALVAICLGGFIARDGYGAEGGKVIIAVGQEPSSIDPSLVFTTPDYVVADNWTEYLIGKNTNGDLKPGLASSWKISPDGKEMEFVLRKGVKFHSGDPLTAKDVEWSIERQRAKNPTVRTRLKLVDKFELIDDYRFRIRFKTPDVTFIPNRGVAVLSKAYYDRVGEETFVRRPMTTSPYKLVKHVPGEYVDIERFDGYWGEKPSIKEARILFVPEDTTRIAKLRAGEVDFISNCPYPAVREIEKSKDLKAIRFANNHPTVSVTFSTRNPKVPCHDKRVRLAMALALDCDTIVKNVLQGIPNRWPFLAPHELGYDAGVKHYPFDPKKAKELLAEAGYPKGFEFKFYWPITGRLPMSRAVAETLAAYWEAVGIRTVLVGEEFVQFETRQRAGKAADAEYVNLGTKGRAGGSDPSYTLDLFFGSDGGFSLYANPDLDKVIAEAKATVNDAKRAAVIKKAIRLIQEEVATVPIYNTVSVYAMKKSVEFKPTQKHTHDLVLVKDITVK